jgi:hypothetical protein
MKIKADIRNKRIQQISELYNLIIANNETAKEELYKIIKDVTKKNADKIILQTEDYIYDILSQNLSTTLTELKKIYGENFNEKEILNIEDAFYNEDGKTISERIENWIKGILDEEEEKPDKNDILILFYHLCLIVDNETFRIIVFAIKNKILYDYVEILSGEGCDICSEYSDGEAHLEEDIVSPPYHPGCQCIEIAYAKEDIKGDI